MNTDFAKLKNLLSICLSLFLRIYLSKYLSEFCEYGPRVYLTGHVLSAETDPSFNLTFFQIAVIDTVSEFEADETPEGDTEITLIQVIKIFFIS